MKTFKQMLEEAKNVLYEMAFSRNDAESKISGYSYEVNNHICKILADSKNVSVKHWIKEIYNLCLPTSRIKLKNNKRVSKEDLLNWLFETSINNEKQFKDMIEGVIWTYDLETKYTNKSWKVYLKIRDELCNLIISDNLTHTNIIRLFEKII